MTANMVTDPAIIRTALASKEQRLARLVDELTQTSVGLIAVQSLLAQAPKVHQSLSIELVEAISLLNAAVTVVVSAYGRVHRCAEALPTGLVLVGANPSLLEIVSPPRKAPA